MSFVMLAASLCPTAVFAEEERTPVSLGKPVTVSIPALVTQLAKENIVDGNITENRFATSTTPSKPLVVTINLEQVYDVDEIEIVERTVTAPTCADDVTIELGLTTPVTTVWQKVVSGVPLTRDNRIPEYHLGVNNFSFESAMCDTVRITFNKTDGNFIQFQINEISVFGEECADPAYPENIVQGKPITASHSALNSQLSVSNMTDGIVSTRFASYVNGINSPLVVTIDLEGLYEIDYAEVIEYYNNGSTCSELTDIDIGYTDENGVLLWQHYISGVSLASKNGVGALNNPFVATPLVGDKIRFVFDGSPNGYVQYGICELVVFGESADEATYKIGKASVYRNGEATDELTPGEASFEVELPYLINDDGSSKELDIYCGLYDKATNEMKWGSYTVATLGAEERTSVALNIGEDWSDCVAKAFIRKSAADSSVGGINAQIDYEKALVTVEGNAQPGDTVTLISHKDGIVTDTPNYYNEFVADGDFTYSYVMNGEAGSYLVSAIINGTEYKAENMIGFYSNDDLDSIASTDFADAGADDIEELITQSYGVLFDLQGADSGTVAKYMAKDIETNGNYSGRDEMFASFASAVRFDGFASLQTADEIKNAVNDTNSNLPFAQLPSYSAYSKILDSDQQLEICDMLLGVEASHFDDYASAFSEAVILSAVKNMGSWTYAKELFDKNRELLKDIDYDNYDELCGKNENSEVDKAIAGNEFASIDELCDAVNDAIDDALYSNSQQQSSSSNRGHGGGGGGGGAVISLIPDAPAKSETTDAVPPADKNDIADVYKSQYTDMSDAMWAKDAVDYLSQKGIVNGRNAEIFDPHASVTREEFVKMAVAALGLGGGENSLPFDDVSESDWFYPYLAKAYEAGLIKGTSASLFGKGSPISREDVAVIMCRMADGLLPSSADSDFTDSDSIADYAKDSVAKLAKSGIISGMGDGSFAPKAVCTRAQAAVMIYKILNLKEGK